MRSATFLVLWPARGGVGSMAALGAAAALSAVAQCGTGVFGLLGVVCGVVAAKSCPYFSCSSSLHTAPYFPMGMVAAATIMVLWAVFTPFGSSHQDVRSTRDRRAAAPHPPRRADLTCASPQSALFNFVMCTLPTVVVGAVLHQLLAEDCEDMGLPSTSRGGVPALPAAPRAPPPPSALRAGEDTLRRRRPAAGGTHRLIGGPCPVTPGGPADTPQARLVRGAAARPSEGSGAGR